MPELRRAATEARLLALLTSTPGQEVHTRELVRRVSGTPRPVHVALEKLERQGLIQSRRLGPLRMWRMDPGHPLYHSLRELYARTVGVAARIAAEIKGRGAELAFIFGSYARGDDDVTSDIDVFVLGDPDWKALVDLTSKLYGELRREVNFVTYQEVDLRKRVEEDSGFLRELRESPKIWIIGDQDGFDRRIERLAREVRRRHSAAERGPGRGAPQARSRRAQPRASSTSRAERP